MELLFLLSATGALIWLVTLILPWRPWSTREALDSSDTDQVSDISELTVLIPARNEEEEIAATLKGLREQNEAIHVILVDDQSTDRTREIAKNSSLKNLKIIDGSPLPAGWSGKLWALEQGRKNIQTDLVLLIDADIQLQPGILQTALQKMEAENLSFLSLMAHLRMKSLWEKLLIPSFIYFFKLLYPFRIGNSRRIRFGVAAGGFILVKRRVLEAMGGFSAIQGRLIDDCSFAQEVKKQGEATWTGLTRSVISHRGYETLGPIWNMVARTAYTQLFYSPWLLALCSFLMISAFIALPLGLPIFADYGWLLGSGVLALFVTYLPTIRFYRLSPIWVFGIIPAGVLYLLMTWTSAYRYYRGRRSEWKGRVYD